MISIINEYLSGAEFYFRTKKFGGDGGDRTPGLYVANVPLSHLSYIPTEPNKFVDFFNKKPYYTFLKIFSRKRRTFWPTIPQP